MLARFLWQQVEQVSSLSHLYLDFLSLRWVTEAQGGRASFQASQPEAKVRDLGSPDAQPLAFAMWGLPDPSVRSSAFWKPLES